MKRTIKMLNRTRKRRIRRKKKTVSGEDESEMRRKYGNVIARCPECGRLSLGPGAAQALWACPYALHRTKKARLVFMPAGPCSTL